MAKNNKYSKMPKNYYNYFDICKWENIPTGTAKGILDKGLDGIAGNEVLKPIAHQFKCFPKYENGNLRNQYGILQTNYNYYKENGEPRKQTSGRPPKWKDNPNLTNINIPFPKDLYEEFKDIVDNANKLSVSKVNYRDMIYVSVREFCDRRPQFKSEKED